MNDPIEEALASIGTAGSPPGWAYDIIAAALRASRLEVELWKDRHTQMRKKADEQIETDSGSIGRLSNFLAASRKEVEALKLSSSEHLAGGAGRRGQGPRTGRQGRRAQSRPRLAAGEGLRDQGPG